MRKLALIIAGALWCTAAAAQNTPWMQEGPLKGQPPGWTKLCEEYPAECMSASGSATRVKLDSGALKELRDVNHSVNAFIKPKTDLEHWGVRERWNFAEDGYGDCEDYVLLKRRKLMALGFPQSSLLVTGVVEGHGEGHAVLTVVTTDGDVVLDNKTDEVKPWYYTGYQYKWRQSQEDQNEWVSLDVLPVLRFSHLR